MNSMVSTCRKFYKRHTEALFIVAFILADLSLSGHVLVLATLAAIAYVALPAMQALRRLAPIDRISYINAYLKTQKVQRLGVVLFWIYGIQFIITSAIDARLFLAKPNIPSLLSLVMAAWDSFEPLMMLAWPLVIYSAAFLVSAALRSRLKPSKEDPDLILNRQNWASATQSLFTTAFIASILSITLNSQGPSIMLSNWLLASARDANMFYSKEDIVGYIQNGFGLPPVSTDTLPQLRNLEVPKVSADSPAPQTGSAENAQEIQQVNPEASLQEDQSAAPMLHPVVPDSTDLKFINAFDTFVIVSTSLAAFVMLVQPALALNALLTSFSWRVVSARSLHNVIESFIEVLRLPARHLRFRASHQFFNNAVKTLVWLVSVYAGLFWLFGFCGGPLGYAIQNWMMASVADAGFVSGMNAPAWIFDPNLRIFLGSIAALYGTAPVAVSAAVFLPHAKARTLTLNSDGLFFPQGPYLSLEWRQFRLWSDLKELSVRSKKAKNGQLKANFRLTFRSGGKVCFDNKQIDARDLRFLLDLIDQYAGACSVAPEVVITYRALEELEQDKIPPDGGNELGIENIPAQEFKSTVFVPFNAGEFIPESKVRVIKLLSSKPLCAVYLGRNDDGRLVTVKQFYLPAVNDETKALAKILTREYDLLTRLDHTGIAKVVSSFTVEKSTFLVIEHRVGIDLRKSVQEHGPRSEALAVSWARQLCEIMIYLHQQDPPILHRDLTPDNIIAGEDGQLRLIDFGAAREFLDGITGTMLGKRCYVSPEQLRGDANQQSDIYSFGGTLNYLLTGRDPVALSQSSPAKHVECSEEVDKLIHDCTEFDFQNRPQSFVEVLRRLNDINCGVRIKLPTSQKEEVLV